MAITRRVFLKNGALAIVGTSIIPSFLTRAVYAADTAAGAGKKRLVVLFQRGAADGLNIVVPHGESAYYSMRPSIAISRPRNNGEGAIDLDGFFGLHPAMSAFKPLWEQKHLAIVHATGSPDNTRSHFDAQDYMESGTPGLKATEDGWLNRALAGVKESGSSPFRAISMGGSLPRTLAGQVPAVAIGNIREFAVGRGGPAGNVASNTFEAMYAQSVDTVLHGTGSETFEAVKMLRSADPEKYTPAPGANYPRGRFGDSLRQEREYISPDRRS